MFTPEKSFRFKLFLALPVVPHQFPNARSNAVAFSLPQALVNVWRDVGGKYEFA